MKSDAPSKKLASLPPVDRVLAAADAQALVATHGRKALTVAVRTSIATFRDALRQGAAIDVGIDSVLKQAGQILARDASPSLRPVYNLTGTVLHTNLGRAALPPEAIDAVVAVAQGASNLEYDLETGRRGDRDSHLEALICEITGAEAATVVNNNAAAVMLVLNTLAFGREVPVSRGELVEIGGSFRIPDIMARSGCRLVEVGTTNRTHLKDFAAAIGPETAMAMKVHTSNYIIEGFTAVVPEQDLAKLCADHDLPFVNDLGSGTLCNLEHYGLPHEPTPMEALRDGADVVTFSGDKLLGGPQAGLVVGRRDLIKRIRTNPMKRAMRCDKMTIAALTAVLQLYRNPDRLAERLPALRDLTRPIEDLDAAAHRVRDALGRCGFTVDVIDCESQIGSGALPTRTVSSRGVAIVPTSTSVRGGFLENLAAQFRRLPVPVIGRINDGQMIFDVRCLSDEAGFIAQLDQLPGEHA